MKPWVAALGVTFVLLVASLAFGQQERPVSHKTRRKGSSTYAELASAPEKARLRPNPLAQDAGAVTAGRVLFQRHCAECHGDNADGKKGPSLRDPEVQNATSGAIFWLLTNGVVRKGMPVWSRLPEPQRWQLVAYIKSLQMKPADSVDNPHTNR